jgi:hypothetical protein
MQRDWPLLFICITKREKHPFLCQMQIPTSDAGSMPRSGHNKQTNPDPLGTFEVNTGDEDGENSG